MKQQQKQKHERRSMRQKQVSQGLGRGVGSLVHGWLCVPVALGFGTTRRALPWPPDRDLPTKQQKLQSSR